MNHPYLSDAACVYRLLKEYEQHKSLVVAVDFDNTIFDFHDKNHDYQEVIDLVRECKEVGFYIIIWTAEADRQKVESFCMKNYIKFDKINENPPFFKSESRKIYHNILLDDRAGLSSAVFQLKEVLSIINNKI